jgi:hypothetical protein
MTKPTKVIVDCSTGEQTVIELTAEEIAEIEAARVVAEAERATQEAEAQAKADAKASALAKLAALGLTEEEAKAIAG